MNTDGSEGLSKTHPRAHLVPHRLAITRQHSSKAGGDLEVFELRSRAVKRRTRTGPVQVPGQCRVVAPLECVLHDVPPALWLKHVPFHRFEAWDYRPLEAEEDESRSAWHFEGPVDRHLQKLSQRCQRKADARRRTRAWQKNRTGSGAACILESTS